MRVIHLLLWARERLEESFVVVPAVPLGSAIKAVYQIGYGMPSSEMIALFPINILFIAALHLTKIIFIPYPIFQLMGQAVSSINDELKLLLLASNDSK